MNDFVLKGSTKTPDIKFSQESGVLEISGRSIPEISFEFYEPVMAWIDDYAKNPQEETMLHAKFEYFNTSSSKQIYDIFKKLDQLHKNNKSNVKVKWFVAEDDETMEEAGIEYQKMVSMPFEIVPIPDTEE